MKTISELEIDDVVRDGYDANFYGIVKLDGTQKYYASIFPTEEEIEELEENGIVEEVSDFDIDYLDV